MRAVPKSVRKPAAKPAAAAGKTPARESLAPFPPFRTGLVRASRDQLAKWALERRLPVSDADTKTTLVAKLERFLPQP